MTYTFTYDGQSVPKWEKIFTAQGGEEFSVSLVFENKEDREQLTAEQAYEFMGLLLQYVKDRTSSLELVLLNQNPPATYWPLYGDYDLVESVMREIQKWWSWAYYNDAFDTDTPVEEEPV